MGLVPLYDRVVVERIPSEEVSPGGILIPEMARERPHRGIVQQVGEFRIDRFGNERPLTVKPGDQVMFGKYSGAEFKLDGKELIILREEDILGIETPTPGGAIAITPAETSLPDSTKLIPRRRRKAAKGA